MHIAEELSKKTQLPFYPRPSKGHVNLYTYQLSIHFTLKISQWCHQPYPSVGIQPGLLWCFGRESVAMGLGLWLSCTWLKGSICFRRKTGEIPRKGWDTLRHVVHDVGIFGNVGHLVAMGQILRIKGQNMSSKLNFEVWATWKTNDVWPIQKLVLHPSPSWLTIDFDV